MILIFSNDLIVCKPHFQYKARFSLSGPFGFFILAMINTKEKFKLCIIEPFFLFNSRPECIKSTKQKINLGNES